MSGIINSAGSRSGVIGQTELDYEEGTWTATLASGAGTGTLYYVKTGNSVHVYGRITHSSDGSGGVGITINNPPFTVKYTGRPGYAISSDGLADAGDTIVYFSVETSAFALIGYPGGGGANASRWLTGHWINFDFTYTTT